jgi:uncharacterized protein (DUF2267 family)
MITKDEDEVINILRAVFHVLRDRITIQHSLHILSNFPAFLKLYYIEEWKYHEKPNKVNTTEDFCSMVEKEYRHLTNKSFPSEKMAEETINITLNALRVFISDSGILKILAELPGELQILFENSSNDNYKNEGLNDLG